MINTSKSRRISHSTSHGETNAGYKCNINTQFTALCYTGIIRATNRQHTAKDMLYIFDTSSLEIRTDQYTDCLDFWQLCCGEKGIPSDKGSRLAILSMREERLSGRIRAFIHIPTEIMLVDGLTKVGLYPVLMRHLTTGFWATGGVPTAKSITMRIADRKQDFDEDDLVQLDH